MPYLLRYTLDEYGTARRTAVVRCFIDALTRGGKYTYSLHLWLLSLIFIVWFFTVKTSSAVLLHRPFYMMSLPPYWCPKTIKWHPCWCPKQSWGQWTLFLSPLQMDATLLDVTCCVHLHTLLHVVHCSELLRKVWNQSNLCANNSQHFFCSVIA